MGNSVNKSRLTLTELIFLLLGMMLLLALARIVTGQSPTPAARNLNAPAQVQQPLYREYRGVRIGMTATEVRAKLGEPAMKSDEQDFYVLSASETVQIAYNATQKAMTISTDYVAGVGAPDYRTVVGEGMLLQRPDGTVFKMVMHDAERFWVTYSRSANTPSNVTITIGAYK